MRIRKPSVRVSLLLAGIAAGTSLLLGSRTMWGAAADSRDRPRARLHIAMEPPRVLFGVSEGRVDYPRYRKTQEILLKSKLVLSSALRNSTVSRLPSMKDRPDPVAWLEQRIVINNPADSEILEISLDPGSGLSGVEQAAIINAVVRAYLDEVVNRDARRRVDRHEQLKKLSVSYANLLKSKRDTMRKLAETVGDNVPLADLKKAAATRLYPELRSQSLQIQLDRAEAETLLARRKKALGVATDVDPRESLKRDIAGIEERLAVLDARMKVVSGQLERLVGEIQSMHSTQTLDIEEVRDEIDQIQDVARKIGAEVEALNVEVDAPPRIRLIDEAHAPGS